LAFVNFLLTATERMEGTPVVEVVEDAAELLMVEPKKITEYGCVEEFSSIPCEAMNLCSQGCELQSLVPGFISKKFAQLTTS
jgi:hypothetical protein